MNIEFELNWFKLFWNILGLIAGWKVFEKMGIAPWKTLIPIYRDYLLFDKVWDANMFWIVLGLELAALVCAMVPSVLTALAIFAIFIVLLVFTVSLYGRLSHSFGKDNLFTAGLVLLDPIFMLILGFSDAQFTDPHVNNVNSRPAPAEFESIKL